MFIFGRSTRVVSCGYQQRPAAPLHPEALHDGLQVEHLLHVARDELPDLVDHEDQALSRLATLHQRERALGELARRDVGLVLHGLHPRVRHRKRVRLQAVQDPARLAQRERELALLDVPILLEELAVLVLESRKLVLLFQADLQLRQIEILGVPKALQEQPVHDLGQRLVAGPDTSVGRDVEDDGVCRDLLGDRPEQHLHLLVVRPLAEASRRGLAGDLPVGDREPEHLREARLAGSEEARHPHRDALVRLVRHLAVRVEDARVVVFDRVGDDVLLDLRTNDLVVRLVDLDDLFNAPMDVVGEELLDGLRCRGRHVEAPQ